MSYRTEKVVVIAKHRGEEELACKRCGCVSSVEDCTYKENNARVRADCPECGAFIKFMRQSVVSRLFDFTSRKMELITEISSGILAWYLQKGKLKPDVEAEVREEIVKRGRR